MAMLPPLTRLEFHALLVTLSWIGGFLPLFTGWRPRWTWLQALGLGLILSPFVRLAIGTAYSVDALVTTTIQGDYVVLPAVSRQDLWLTVFRRMRDYVAIPLLGLLLLWQQVGGLPRRGGPTPLQEGFRNAGLRLHGGWGRDALAGLELFLFVAVGYLFAFIALVLLLTDVLQSTGDESQVFANVTPALVVALALVAGVSEEFLFRGLLLTHLARLMPWGRAALIQAVWFGFIHAGYSTWAHVAGPFVFGLIMAWVVRVVGIVPAILLHAEINVVAFSLGQIGTYPELAWLLGGLVLVNAYAVYHTRAATIQKLWHSLRNGFKPVEDERAVHEVEPPPPGA